MVFKGYATGTGKKATMKVKDAQLLSWDAVQGNQSFGAILNQDFIDISFDTDELSQKFWDMAEKNDWNCLILENPENGHIHSYWKDTEHKIEKGGKDKKLAVGLIADIHSGSTYIPLTEFLSMWHSTENVQLQGKYWNYTKFIVTTKSLSVKVETTDTKT